MPPFDDAQPPPRRPHDPGRGERDPDRRRRRRLLLRGRPRHQRSEGGRGGREAASRAASCTRSKPSANASRASCTTRSARRSRPSASCSTRSRTPRGRARTASARARGDARDDPSDHRVGRTHRPRLPSRPSCSRSASRTRCAPTRGSSRNATASRCGSRRPRSTGCSPTSKRCTSTASSRRRSPTSPITATPGASACVSARHGTRVTATRVSDDGIGFDPETARAGRLGLVTMRERAELIGGDAHHPLAAAGAAPRSASRSPPSPLGATHRRPAACWGPSYGGRVPNRRIASRATTRW